MRSHFVWKITADSDTRRCFDAAYGYEEHAPWFTAFEGGVLTRSGKSAVEFRRECLESWRNDGATAEYDIERIPLIALALEDNDAYAEALDECGVKPGEKIPPYAIRAAIAYFGGCAEDCSRTSAALAGASSATHTAALWAGVHQSHAEDMAEITRYPDVDA